MMEKSKFDVKVETKTHTASQNELVDILSKGEWVSTTEILRQLKIKRRELYEMLATLQVPYEQTIIPPSEELHYMIKA